MEPTSPYGMRYLLANVPGDPPEPATMNWLRGVLLTMSMLLMTRFF